MDSTVIDGTGLADFTVTFRLMDISKIFGLKVKDMDL
jgi:hypothetical protein